MSLKKSIAWSVLAAIIAIGGGVTGVVVYTGLVASGKDSLSAMRAEQGRLEESKVRSVADLEVAKGQLEAAKKELDSLKARLASYRGQINKAERDKRIAQAMRQLKLDYENGTKKGTYIDATHVGAGQNSIKVALKNNDGGNPALPMEHPDSGRLFQIVSEIEDLQSLTVRGLKLKPDDMKVIRGLASLGYLEIGKADLTDEDAREIVAGKSLWGLNLTENPLTVIPPFPAGRFAVLDFRDTQLGDEEVLRIAGRFPKLVHVNLTRTRVTDSGIRSLAPLSQMTFLEFSEVNVGDNGVEPLSSLAKLKTLRIDRTNVSDQGLRSLDGMNDLETVYLRNTGITDEGLMLLAGRPKLHVVNVEHTGITDEGLVKFCKKMGERAGKVDGLTIMIDRKGRRKDIAERMQEACAGISVQAIRD